MRVDLTEQNAVKRSMAFEVDPEEVSRETRAVLQGYAAKARIPGFRPGKAPLSMIQARFKKEVAEDVRERVMTRAFRDATRERGLRPLGSPVVENVEEAEGQPLRFRLSFEVLPEIEVKNYRGVEVRRPPARVEESEVDRALEELRQARTRLVTAEGRGAEKGDVLVCDVKGTPAEGEPFSRERMFVEVGSESNSPEFNERLIGARPGDDLDFTVEQPAGRPAPERSSPETPSPEADAKSVRYELHVHEVKTRDVPDLDAEFARDLGDFADLAALRARVREDLEARKKRESDERVRQSVLEKVMIENPTVLPDVLVEDEIRHRLEDIVRRMYLQGIDPQKIELDWKRLRDQQEEGARRSVHARLVLDAVARAEAIEVSAEEVQQRIRRDAEAIGETYATVRKRLEERGGPEVVRGQMLREKSLDLLTTVANIRNEE
jgi:trigger factor